jgi:hypothetical protein
MDLRGVLSAAAVLCKPGRVWCLTWPTIADRQILLTESNGEPVDLLVATQIEQLPSRREAIGHWRCCELTWEPISLGNWRGCHGGRFSRDYANSVGGYRGP